ncbi:hypothetical protein Bbelb_326320 [Branchiostoma belcheri]|nr:hypothetical protein Bbelb_326320 [Branchiostoma belcheri]
MDLTLATRLATKGAAIAFSLGRNQCSRSANFPRSPLHNPVLGNSPARAGPVQGGPLSRPVNAFSQNTGFRGVTIIRGDVAARPTEMRSLACRGLAHFSAPGDLNRRRGPVAVSIGVRLDR